MRSADPILTMQLFEMPKTNDELFDVISADAIMVRADRFKENTEFFDRLSLTNGVKIYSLLSIESGGDYDQGLKRRHQLLRQAEANYDLIQLDSETDLTSDLLVTIPVEKRIIFWRGKVDTIEALEERLEQLSRVGAKYYHIVTIPDKISDTVLPLQLVERNQDQNLIAYAEGAIGIWTQILSVFMGGKMIIGNLISDNKENDYLPYNQLKEDYGLPRIRKVDQIFGITGNPVFRSLSPLVHNGCYEKLKMNALYLPFHVTDFSDFWELITSDFEKARLGKTMSGFTMVSPFKENTYRASDQHLSLCSKMSKACNILVQREGVWYSDSSDGIGVIKVLTIEGVEFEKARVAILGCGGAGRTIASRLLMKGANVQMFNRSEKRGKWAAELLQLSYLPIEDFDPSEFDVVINATSVGKHGKDLLFDPRLLRSDSVTIDMAYAENDTVLVRRCRSLDRRVIAGKQILLYQVQKQFLSLTGKEMPLEGERIIREKTANLLESEVMSGLV